LLTDTAEMILHRLHDLDEELASALDHLSKNFYGPSTAIRECLEDPSRLEVWRSAEEPSQEWRKGFYFDQALRLLGTDLYD